MHESAPANRLSTGVIQALQRNLASSCVIVRRAAGLLRVSGPDRLDLLHRLSTNDLLRMNPGDVRPTIFATDKGRIVDLADVFVKPGEILLLTSEENCSRLKTWIEKFIVMEDVQIEDISSSRRTVSLLGPQAVAVASSVSGRYLRAGSCAELDTSWGTVEVAPMSGPHGNSVTLLLPASASPDAEEEWRTGAEAIVSTEHYGWVRILSGTPGGGAELGESFNPLEIGLRHAISFTKGCYIGQEVIARLETYQKVQKHLLGAVIDGAASLHPLPLRLAFQGEEVGTLTSVALVGDGAIGLAVVRREIESGMALNVIQASGAPNTVRLVSLPFPPDALDHPGTE